MSFSFDVSSLFSELKMGWIEFEKFSELKIQITAGSTSYSVEVL
jgi:hypothetical protein